MKAQKRVRNQLVRGVVLTVGTVVFLYLPFGPLANHTDEPPYAIILMLGILPALVALPYGVWLIMQAVRIEAAQRRLEDRDGEKN